MPDSVRRIPENPLGFIQRCVRERKIIWTYHVNMRLRTKSIRRDAIVESADAYEIIESYPEDKYLPSYLVYSEHCGDRIHVQFATDVEGDNVRIVTTYRPSRLEWSDDFKTRRVSQ